MFAQTISKWGSSLAIRLPTALARQMQIEEGTKVEMALDGKMLVIQRADECPGLKAFFAAVKSSHEANGLVAVGNVQREEIT